MTENKKNKEVVVSAVVPVYNAAPYLEQCVESLLNQTYQQLEIILVDDGSTDDSYSICQKYEKLTMGKVRAVHKENGGVSSARNMGIALARGAYIIFVDADDLVHKELVEIYMEAADQEQVLLCHITNDRSDLEKKFKDKWREETSDFAKDNFMELFVRDYINSPCNKLYHAAVLKENRIQYPEHLSLGEDLIFNLKYLQHVPSGYKLIKCPLYCYLDDHTGSLTNGFRRDLFDIQLELFRILKAFLCSEKIWNIENQRLYYMIFWDRLYLTVRIYLMQKKNADQINSSVDLKEILRHPVWKSLEQECRMRHLMNWKRVLKKGHLMYLKKTCK